MQPTRKNPNLKKDHDEAPEVDPERGDTILRRMLKSKPKQHKDMVAERKAKRETKKSYRKS